MITETFRRIREYPAVMNHRLSWPNSPRGHALPMTSRCSTKCRNDSFCPGFQNITVMNPTSANSVGRHQVPEMELSEFRGHEGPLLPLLSMMLCQNRAESVFIELLPASRANDGLISEALSCSLSRSFYWEPVKVSRWP